MHSKELGRGLYSAFRPNNHLEHEGVPSCPSASRSRLYGWHKPLIFRDFEPENDGFPKQKSHGISFWGGLFSGSMLIFWGCKLARRFSWRSDFLLHLPQWTSRNTTQRHFFWKAKMLYSSIKTSKRLQCQKHVNGNHVNTQHSGRWQVYKLPIFAIASTTNMWWRTKVIRIRTPKRK